MARGWESKAVEDQMNAAEAGRTRVRTFTKTPEQLHRETEIETIELNRRRVLHDLDAASNPRYQEMLRASLQYLDEKLAALRNAG
jgi:hypothetical protein